MIFKHIHWLVEGFAKPGVLSVIKSFLVGLLFLTMMNCQSDKEFDLLITGGSVVDGSGQPAFRADVAISKDQIVLISEDPVDPARADQLIEAEGKVIAPGFIDIHSHYEPIFEYPGAESHIRQGVTTGLGGPDGSSPWPIATTLDSLEQVGTGVNVAYTVGHNTIRQLVMEMDNRAPTEEELHQMKELTDRAMREGAWGISTGLKYTPGNYAETDELVELSKVVANYNGIYTSHLRDEGLNLMDSVQELISIAEQSGVAANLTHHKVVGSPMWGESKTSLAKVDSARQAGLSVSLDQYPYTASYTTISILVPEWAEAGGRDKLLERLEDSALRDSIKQGIVYNIIYDRGGNDLDRVQLARVPWNRDLEGKTLKFWAESSGMDPTPETGAELVIQILENGGASAIYHVMDEEDVNRIMRYPHTMIGSDGRLTEPGNGHPHPRWYGTFPRVLGKYVREDQLISLEEAVKKMTSMPADLLGIDGRGYIKEGYFADLVVFDADEIIDNATFLDPHQYPSGIDYVLVNGGLAVENGRFHDIRTGRTLRKNVE